MLYIAHWKAAATAPERRSKNLTGQRKLCAALHCVAWQHPVCLERPHWFWKKNPFPAVSKISRVSSFIPRSMILSPLEDFVLISSICQKQFHSLISHMHIWDHFYHHANPHIHQQHVDWATTRPKRRCSINMLLVNVWICLMTMISQQEPYNWNPFYLFLSSLFFSLFSFFFLVNSVWSVALISIHPRFFCNPA